MNGNEVIVHINFYFKNLVLRLELPQLAYCTVGPSSTCYRCCIPLLLGTFRLIKALFHDPFFVKK